MMAKLILCVNCLLVMLTIVRSADYVTEQPDFLPACVINDPDFVPCSTKSIQSLFKQLSKGIPGMKTLDKIDPFFINKIYFDQNLNNVLNLKADVRNVLVTGLGETIVKESKVSKKDYSWDTKVLIPILRIEGDYSMNGRVLLVPLEGSGKMFMQPENLDIVIHTKTRLYEKGGFTFYNVTSVKIDLSITNLKSNLENLFNGNQELGNSVNAFFNENWKDFFEAMRPIVTQTIEKILLSVLQKVFHFIPANFFVSDIPTSVQLYGGA